MKKNLLIFILGFLPLLVMMYSCTKAGKELKEAKLEVSQTEDLVFESSGNDDVMLTVTTDADSWSFKHPEWVVATKPEGEDCLVINVKENNTGKSRAGRIDISAENAMTIRINVIQNEKPENEEKNTLTVTPSDGITFLPENNEPVVLTVTTDAGTWAFDVPEWVSAEKDEEKNTLTVSAEDNNTDINRAGRIEITAGTEKTGLAVIQKKVGETDNVLSVEPSEDLSFSAEDTKVVSLSVATDAESWSYSVPEWINAEKKENILEVSADANLTGNNRAGRIEIHAGNAEPVTINVIQTRKDESGDNSLTVLPSEDIIFEAEGNSPVTLEISTDAESWNYMAPDWVAVTKEDNTLTLNVSDNAGNSSKAGRLVITAGSAAPVSVSLYQKMKGESETGPDPDAVSGMLKDESGMNELSLEMKEADLDLNMVFSLAEPSDENAEVEILFDAEYLREYNFVNGTDYRLFPEELLDMKNGSSVTLDPGTTTSGNIGMSARYDEDKVAPMVKYMIPLCVRPKSDNVNISYEYSRVNYIVELKLKRPVKNIMIFEVNDVNPLNALEFKMEDGQYLFDAVVIFSANINYNSDEDRVYLHQNPQVSMLMSQQESFIQPLRRAGIEVYLGVLGNHDPAGIAQLSDYGSQMFANELAQAVKKYNLDGVFFDDEWSTTPTGGSSWLAASASTKNAARLCLETKKAMGPDKVVSVFYYGQINKNFPSFTEGDTVWMPGDYVDIAIANYSYAAEPMDGMSLRQCTGASIDMNFGGIEASGAQNVVKQGYGWIMWYALNPEKENFWSSQMYGLRNAARGIYDQELVDPTHYYKFGSLSRQPF